jgi:anti-sigma regulatory factor (Ser/Thr protein kinase)
MRHFKYQIYNLRKNEIIFSKKINSFSIVEFKIGLNDYFRTGKSNLNISFKRVEKIFPNGILPIICTIDELRLKGHKIYIFLPEKGDIRRLFRSVNWAYYLAPEQFYKSESTHDRHLVTRRFETAEQQKIIVDDFMDVVLRNMTVPKDVISGLEWSINEITDNVLNHSDSQIGGLMQASTFTKDNKIVFAVSDSGKGILESMKEALPDLRTSSDAIGEAIKSGVTRNPKFGQGNGLAGTLRITTLTGGSLEILSGNGKLKVTEKETFKKQLKDVDFNGTMVSGEINLIDDFSISKALDFNGYGDYLPLDIIDLKYELSDQDCLELKMKEETTGFGSRKSGLQIRTKILNLLKAKPSFPLIIDWSGVPVISSSFADELIGKLFLEMGPMTFMSRIKNKSMEYLIQGLLDKAISQRLTQAIDDE